MKKFLKNVLTAGKKLDIGMKLLQTKFQASHLKYLEFQNQKKVVLLSAIRIAEM